MADAMQQVRDGQAEVQEALQAPAWRFPKTAQRAVRMMQALYVEGFASFG